MTKIAPPGKPYEHSHWRHKVCGRKLFVKYKPYDPSNAIFCKHCRVDITDLQAIDIG